MGGRAWQCGSSGWDGKHFTSRKVWPGKKAAGAKRGFTSLLNQNLKIVPVFLCASYPQAAGIINRMTARSKEQRYAETGMTAAQVDELIVRMKTQGYGLKAIGAAVGLTTSGVHRAVARLTHASTVGADPRRQSARP